MANNIVADIDVLGLRILILLKIYKDVEMENKLGTFVDDFPIKINTDTDVYDENGKILLRFRKNIIPKTLLESAYEILKKQSNGQSDARTHSSGGKNISVKSNIIGYYDKHSISEIYEAKRKNKPLPNTFLPRQTGFVRHNLEQFKKLFPFFKSVDDAYKLLCPCEYEKQKEAADMCDPYRIPETSFTTLTINKNYRTACHKDVGDFQEGFGNLTVFEVGEYKGAYTGFPQYGVGVDVRTGDFLAMDVHQIHCNTPIIPVSPGHERISFVCYLRQGILDKLQKYRI